MTRYIDLSRYWTEDSGLSIQKAHEQTKIAKQTLSVARRGFLDRAQIDTIFKLLELASELAGKKLSLEDITTEK
jgi:hypothetical protein